MTIFETLRQLFARRVRLGAVAGLAAVVAVVLVGRGGPDRSPERDPGGDTSGGQAEGATAARAFLDRYTEADGRVVRRDQGGDTVSEGQAYAMLVAVGTGDQARFLVVWDWTRRNLQRPDALLSWRWKDGSVVDPQPAADADVDAARALLEAGERFGRPDLRAEGIRIAGGVLDHEVVTAGSRSALAAGPWAVAGRVVNPGYLASCTAGDLARATGDLRWQRLADDAVALIDGLTEGGHRLPPDWSRLDDTGALQPLSRDGDGGGSYGLDAARVPLRLAAPCNAAGTSRHLAATLWSTLRNLPDDGALVTYHLDGTPAVPPDARHPAGLVGAAAAAGAAGDEKAADRLLEEAAALDRHAPTYYGAALLALAETSSVGHPAAMSNADTNAAGRALGDANATALPGLRLIASTKPPRDSTTTTTVAPPTTATSSPSTTSPPTTSPSTTSPSTTSPPTTSPSTTSPSTTSPSTTSPSTTSPSTTSPSTTSPSTTTSPSARGPSTSRPSASTPSTAGSPPGGSAGAGPTPPATAASTPPDGPTRASRTTRPADRSAPAPLRPGILTLPPTATTEQPPPTTATDEPLEAGLPAPPTVPTDSSAPARTTVLLIAAGLTALLGALLGRRAI